MKKSIIIYIPIFLLLNICVFTYGSEMENNKLNNNIILIEKGMYQDAEKGLKGLLENLPSDDDSRKKVFYELGRALLGQERGNEALPLIKPYFKENPEQGQVVFSYALALLQSGSHEEAIGYFGKAIEYDPDLSDEAIFYTGTALNDIGRSLEAMIAFHHVAENYPEFAKAKDAEKMYKELFGPIYAQLQESEKRHQAFMAAFPKSPTKEKPWTFSLGLGTDYDDNVSQLPDSTITIPEGISSKSDWRFAHSLSGSYLLYEDNNHRLRTSASYTGTNHDGVENFDVDSLSASLFWGYTKDSFQIGLDSSVSQSWLASDRDSRYWGLRPSLTYRIRPWTWTTLDYNYGNVDYFRTPPTPEENRDSDSHAFSLSQWFSSNSLLLNGYNTLLGLGINHSITNSKGSSYENDATEGHITVMQGLALDLTLLCSFSYREISYDNANIRSTSGLTRSDDERVFNITIFRKINDYLTAYAGYRYYDNDSNIPDFFEYHSNVYSVGVKFDF